MIVSLQLGLWTGQRLDKAASAKVTADANAEADAARVNKHIIPKTSLKAIQHAAGQLRLHFYDRTLPWKDNGDRVLTRVMYPTFIEEHGRKKQAFTDAVIEFLRDEYPKEVARAEFRMGDLFKRSDYPSPRSLLERFYVNLEIGPVSEAKDFRVTLDKDAREQIKSEIEQAQLSRIAEASKHAWDRLATTLGHFAERMSGDGVWKDATVENLAELVDILPGLNITGDPDLNRIADEIKTNILGLTPKQLRKSPEARESVSEEAKRIMEDIGGFMKAFGNG
jgi:hypothetical protein